MHSIALIIHLVGVVLWIGGGAAGALAAMAATVRPKETREASLSDVRRALLYVSSPGLVLAFVGVLALLVPAWDSYRSMGWVHAKLTLGLVLAGVSGVLGARLRRAATGERESPAGLFAGLGGALAIGGVLSIVLVILRPF